MEKGFRVSPYRAISGLSTAIVLRLGWTMDQTKDPGSHDHALSPLPLPSPDGGGGDAFTKVPIHRKFLKQPPRRVVYAHGMERRDLFQVLSWRGNKWPELGSIRESARTKADKSASFLSCWTEGISKATLRNGIEFPRGSTVVNPSVRKSTTLDRDGPRITRAKNLGGE